MLIPIKEKLQFSFSVNFSKFSSRPKARLHTIHEMLGFSCFVPFLFQCNTCLQYASSCLAKV